MSFVTAKWHWFPRGGALMALCGFIVAVRETLLWRPYRPSTAVGYTHHRSETTALAWEPLGADRKQQAPAWEPIAEHREYEERGVVGDEGDEGRPMRDTSTFTVEELTRLRNSSILGVLGTFIWAFGDLLGGLPH